MGLLMVWHVVTLDTNHMTFNVEHEITEKINIQQWTRRKG